MRFLPLIAGAALLAGCNGGDQTAGNAVSTNDTVVTSNESIVVNDSFEAVPPDETVPANAGDETARVEPIEPGKPGGLPDDRTPISEAKFTQDSAQGAANVVQTYYALIGEKKYGEAYDLWDKGAAATTRAAFVQNFGKYTQYDAQIGAPGTIEGAAGSRYVEVPVQVYGRAKSGAAFHKLGKVTLRRVGDVDGATAEQKRWHIYKNDATPNA